ncbi:hypothetical protein TNCV_65851 [Trichonephila clavipes]|nr:hypothetical protein TNCV_65851 [Trichonephila clavipes]
MKVHIRTLNPPTGQNGFFRPTREASKMDCTDFSAFNTESAWIWGSENLSLWMIDSRDLTDLGCHLLGSSGVRSVCVLPLRGLRKSGHLEQFDNMAENLTIHAKECFDPFDLAFSRLMGIATFHTSWGEMTTVRGGCSSLAVKVMNSSHEFEPCTTKPMHIKYVEAQTSSKWFRLEVSRWGASSGVDLVT